MAGDMYQWLVVWRACMEMLRDQALANSEPVVAVGVEVDGAGNLDDVVLFRENAPDVYCQVKYATAARELVGEEYLLQPGRKGGLSVLARLVESRRRLAEAKPDLEMVFITTRALDPHDPLTSGCDTRTGLLMPRAAVGSPRSARAAARARWAEAVGISTDELLELLSTLRFETGLTPLCLETMVSAMMGSLGLRGDQSAVAAGADWVARQVRDGRRRLGPAELDETIRLLRAGTAPSLRWRIGPEPQRADCYQERREPAEPAPGSGTAVSTQVLVGLGGVGKTQLAAAYAERLWQAGSVDLLVWVTASSRAAILTAYARAASEITGASDADADRFLAYLATADVSWLVVLDDVATPGDLNGLWPPRRSTGQCVVTTRRRDAALTGAERRLFEVGLFTAEESARYLTAKLAEHPRLAVGSDPLASDLGHLPLALAQAAAYLIDRGMTCEDYSRRLTDRRRRLSELSPEPESLPDAHRSAVAAAWSLSIELANGLRPVGLARPLLELAAVLDPNGVPLELFTVPAVLARLGVAIGRPVGREDVLDGLQTLRRLSLLNIDDSANARVVRVHALVQRATRECLTDDQLRATIRTGADALIAVWPSAETDPLFGQCLRDNATALAGQDSAALLESGVHRVLFRAGDALGESGAAHAAATYWAGLRSDAARVLRNDNPDVLACRGRTAFWKGEAGDVAGAVSAYSELLEDHTRALGSDHPETLATRHELASWTGMAGDAQGAVTALSLLLTDRAKILGMSHLDTLTTRHELGYWLSHAGESGYAITVLSEVLADRMHSLGLSHPDTLRTRGVLAHSQGMAGDASGAAESYAVLLADRTRLLGADHPHTLTTRHNLARWRGEAGDIAGARAALTDLLQDQLRILGPDHPHTHITQQFLAKWSKVLD